MKYADKGILGLLCGRKRGLELMVQVQLSLLYSSFARHNITTTQVMGREWNGHAFNGLSLLLFTGLGAKSRVP